MKKVIAFLLAIVCVAAGVFVGSKLSSSKTDISITEKYGFEDIGELATEEYYFTKVKSYTGDPKMLFGKAIPFTTSKIIYSVDGCIKAGCNFSDIVVDRNDEKKEIIVTLPEISVLGIDVDTKNIKIFDEKNSIFNPLSGAETFNSLDEVKLEAKADAVKQGILDKAYDNAKVIIEGFVNQNVPEGWTVVVQ